MDKLREKQTPEVTRHAANPTKCNRTAFRRILHTERSCGFLCELQNPGLWNDFVVEMVLINVDFIVCFALLCSS